RQVFLYPENWLELTVREDKTDIFRDFESRIIEQDLSWESFVNAVKGYVGGLAAIADLDVQAYVRDNNKSVSDTYHLFSCTRNAPYHFFHRRLDVSRATPSDITRLVWSPWARMEIDTPIYEADWNDKALQQTGTYIIPIMRRN